MPKTKMPKSKKMPKIEHPLPKLDRDYEQEFNNIYNNLHNTILSSFNDSNPQLAAPNIDSMLSASIKKADDLLIDAISEMLSKIDAKNK
jgi:hypothetical protein